MAVQLLNCSFFSYRGYRTTTIVINASEFPIYRNGAVLIVTEIRGAPPRLRLVPYRPSNPPASNETYFLLSESAFQQLTNGRGFAGIMATFCWKNQKDKLVVWYRINKAIIHRELGSVGPVKKIIPPSSDSYSYGESFEVSEP